MRFRSLKEAWTQDYPASLLGTISAIIIWIVILIRMYLQS